MQYSRRYTKRLCASYSGARCALSATDLTVNVYIGQIVLGASACPATGRFSMLGYYDPSATGGGMLTLMGGTQGANPFQYLTLRLRRSG